MQKKLFYAKSDLFPTPEWRVKEIHRQKQRRRCLVALLFTALLSAFPFVLSWSIKIWLLDFLPARLGVDAQLVDLHLNPFTGSVEINGLALAQPKGFEDPFLLEAGSIKGNINFLALFEHRLQIKNVEFDGLKFVLLCKKQAGLNVRNLALWHRPASLSREQNNAEHSKKRTWAFDIRRIAFTNCAVSWRDDRFFRHSLTLDGLCGLATNVVVSETSRQIGQGIGSFWLNGALQQTGRQPTDFQASGWVARIAGGAPDGAIDLSLLDFCPREILRDAWPGAADSFAETQAVDVALATGISAQGADFALDVTDNSGRQIVHVGNVFYAFSETWLEAGDIHVEHPSGTLARPLLHLPWVSFKCMATEPPRFCALDFERPLLTWLLKPSNNNGELFVEDGVKSTDAFSNTTNTNASCSTVLERLRLAGGDVALWAVSDQGSFCEIARLFNVDVVASNVWLAHAQPQQATLGEVAVAGALDQPGFEHANWMIKAQTMPGEEGDWPTISITGKLTGLTLPLGFADKQREWAAAFAPGPYGLECSGGVNSKNSNLALRFYDATGAEVFCANGLGYDRHTGEGRLALSGLSQPFGFGPGRFVMLSNVWWRMEPDFLVSRQIKIKEGAAMGFDATLSRNSKGVLNLAFLSEISSWVTNAGVSQTKVERAAESQGWGINVDSFIITNANLFYQTYASSFAEKHLLASCNGSISGAAPPFGAESGRAWCVASCAGVLKQTPEENASFHANLNVACLGAGLADLDVLCGFERLKILSFGSFAPFWCSAALGDTPLNGNLHIRMQDNCLTASGRVEDVSGATAAGFDSFSWDIDADEWRVRGLTLAQPESFGTNFLVKIGEARLSLDGKMSSATAMVINDFEASDVSANISRNKHGVWNWGILASGKNGQNPIPESRPERRGVKFADAVLKHARLDRLSVIYTDDAAGESQLSSRSDVFAAECRNIVLRGRKPGDWSAGEFCVQAGLNQAGAAPACLNIEGRQECSADGALECYATICLAGWSPRDFLLPKSRLIWERDIGPIDLAAAAAWSRDLFDITAEARLAANGRLLATCNSAEWHPAISEAGVNGLYLASPPGNRFPTVFVAPELRVRFAPGTFAGTPVAIRESSIKAPLLCFARNRFGECNTDYLEALFMATSSTGANKAGLLIERAAIENMRVRYEDSARGADPLRLDIARLNVCATNLAFGGNFGLQEKFQGKMRVCAEIEQGESAPGSFDLEAETFVAPHGDLVIDAQSALIGLAPESLACILPSAFLKGLKGETLSLMLNGMFSSRYVGFAASLDTFNDIPLLKIGAFDFWRDTGEMMLNDLYVAQPPNFGEGPLLLAQTASARLTQSQTPEVGARFEQMEMNGIGGFPVRNKEGKLNALVMADFLRASPIAYREGAERPLKSANAIVIDSFSAENVFGMYSDFSGAGALPTIIRADGIKALGANICFGVEQDTGQLGIGEFAFAGRLLQSPLTNGYVGGLARFGVLNAKTPTLQAAFRVAGLELPTLAGWLPANTAELLGGDAVDVAAEMKLLPEHISCELRVLTCSDTRFSMTLKGAPGKPEIDTSSVLYGILERAGGGLGATFHHVALAGFDALRSTFQSTFDLGEGALKAVGSFGTGLFTTMRGLVMADFQEAGEGLSQSTVGAVGKTADAILRTGEGLLNMAMRTATHRSRAEQEWRASNFKRWQNAWQEARQVMDNQADVIDSGKLQETSEEKQDNPF